MDAHVFRRLCDTLAPLLTGARLEKIQAPAPSVHTFIFHSHSQGKRQLLLRADRRSPFLFLTSQRQSAGIAPGADVMRLRKYLCGHRVLACHADWSQRRLHLLFQGAPKEDGSRQECWLTLDLRDGPRLWLNAAPELSPEPEWPVAGQLAQALNGDGWRGWPVLSPALRRTLPLLEPLEQEALLADLAVGGGDLFVYAPQGEDGLSELFAWPLPPALRGGREETALEDPLEAAEAVGRELVLGGLAREAGQRAAAPHSREEDRLTRLLAKLDAEEARLRGMAACKAQALALQAQLWRFAPDARMAAVDLPAEAEAAGPLNGRAAKHDAADSTPSGTRGDTAGGTRAGDATASIPLNPRLTLRENMAALFHTAERGARGLIFLEQRRERLRRERHEAGAAARAARLGVPGTAPAAPQSAAPRSGRSTGGALPKGVQAFLSSDGFPILRGKDAKGNWALLKAAAPHDLWMHVEGGPGSHAVIRRNFTGQEIPERTLREAGGLAAAKSWQRDSQKAHMLCAEVRHVKPLRGAAPGTVRVDKVALTFQVDVDASLETLLTLREEF